MEFLKLNINSTKPFYTDKDGKIYNRNYKELKGVIVNNCAFLSYVINDINKTPVRVSFARLVYKRHFPDEDLTNYNIFKKKPNIENPNQIDNLIKVKKQLMPVKNKLPAMHANKIKPLKRKFYQKLENNEYNKLIEMAKNPHIQSTKIAKIFSVGVDTVRKHRPYLEKRNKKSING